MEKASAAGLEGFRGASYLERMQHLYFGSTDSPLLFVVIVSQLLLRFAFRSADSQFLIRF